MTARKYICVFCGAHTGNAGNYVRIVRDVAGRIAAAGFGIVYGGGRVGLMGVLADAALSAGTEVIGVIPEALAGSEIAHGGLTRLHVVGSMHERKALMADASDAFIALPGGFGTMDELCEILTWAQLQIHDKPVGLLNAGGYYDELLAFFDRSVREGFVSAHNRGLLRVANAIDELLQVMGLQGAPPRETRDYSRTRTVAKAVLPNSSGASSR
ncbi:MAG: LOG family protein [Vulcanimicrobiaceae bacterium]